MANDKLGATLAVVTAHRFNETPLIEPLLVFDIEIVVIIDPGY